MGFKPAPNMPGRVFVPDEDTDTRRKHTCSECFQCQMCGEDRCQVCRTARECKIDVPVNADTCCCRALSPEATGTADDRVA